MDPHTARVHAVFEQVAPYYDSMNDWMSLGLHRIWKRLAVARLDLHPQHRILDLAGGTGDLSRLMAPKLQDPGHISIVDINAAMLHQGQDRLINAGITQGLDWIQADAEALPIQNDYFDRAIMGFGLRNTTHIDQVLSEILRVLRPGGRLLVLEFSTPRPGLINRFYQCYSQKIIPALGEWLHQDAESYQYLIDSIRLHPDQAQLKKMFETAGFTGCSYQNLHEGIVAIHIGHKPC